MTDEGPSALEIFLVEDHPDTLQYFALYLESMGHHVRHASSVEGALRDIPESGCDVPISDVGLRDGTGRELMEKLRNSGRRYPSFSIAMSGYGRNTDRQKSEA